MTTVSSVLPQPWDRLPGEPPASYARFLFYRNLGPGRTLQRAYATYAGVPEGTKRRLVPGRWRKDSATWRWVERSREWDLIMLTEAGKEAVVVFVAAVKQVSTRLLMAALDPDVRLDSWSQVIETLDAVGAHIPTGLVQQVAERDKNRNPAPNSSRVVQ